MKQLNTYIIEKLRLNKDIKVEDKLTDIKNCVEEFLNKLQKKFKYEIKILNIEKQSLYTRSPWDNDDFVRVEFSQYIQKDIFRTLFQDLSKYLKDNINNLYTRWDNFLPAKGRRYGIKYIDILITKQENISEKLIINKDSRFEFDKTLLDKKFSSMDELAEAFYEYFGSTLAEPIKVVKTEVVFRPVSQYSKDGRFVKDHFIIKFNTTPSQIRFGLRRDTGLQMQIMYKDPINGKIHYGNLIPNNYTTQYHFGDNFLEWLTNSKNKKEFSIFLKYFKIEE